MSEASAIGTDTAELRKARGAFFTPLKVTEFIAEWALRTGTEEVLEPSCGEAAFLVAAADRFAQLGWRDTPTLHGVELHAESARTAKTLVEATGTHADVIVSDFFLLDPAPRYDVVIGNPPYVRYQDFAGESRSRSRAAALRGGVNLTALASSWAAFTVHSALFLKPGGRMGLVLPAELLSVNYAAEIRSFLMRSFAEVQLVMFDERVFPGVLEEVVLLLADGYQNGAATHMSIYQVSSPNDLTPDLVAYPWTPTTPGGKWTPSLLGRDALAAYSSAVRSDAFTRLEDWGDTTLGMVTGNNKYFALSPERVRELGLIGSDLVRLSPPGSKHLRGLELTKDRLRNLGEEGAATWLFRPAGTPSPAGQAYIDAGHRAGVDTAYKCRVRSPWWRVPVIQPADLFLTYMNADTPRITTNKAGAHHLNSVHGIYLQPHVRDIGLELLPVASLNSLTLLGAEMVGRAYGGGMLKLEPREADELPVPSPTLVASAAGDLAQIKPAVRSRLRAGDLLGATVLVDEVLLAHDMHCTATQITAIRAARAALYSRRAARGGEPRTEA
ncbi:MULTISPECIES: HsdM family class I SAM-dependent methyltransferase [unclassified Curtobacterium]|uniref:HsdM family class I SAM-dependent methyltransferase n=1 Tax=unclassified Curtobacterium TaxID=257496 RepID=UPI00226B9D67|nr:MULTISPECIES: N-6 DNA methylase [unclassified Curtobacterium]